MNKRFLLILVGIIVVVAGIFWFTRPNKSNAPGGGQPSHHVKGEGTKKVTLIEYGDYQCPACGQYYPVLNQIYDKYKTDIIFQFRNFPLDSIHQNARAAARAAEAADKQGKFWEMHDKLYETQTSWQGLGNPTSVFEGYAKDLGLDVAKFKVNVQSAEVNAIINADISEGQKIKANSTPTFTLNGVKLDPNPPSLEAFNQVIDAEIAKQNPTTPPPPADL